MRPIVRLRLTLVGEGPVLVEPPILGEAATEEDPPIVGERWTVADELLTVDGAERSCLLLLGIPSSLPVEPVTFCESQLPDAKVAREVIGELQGVDAGERDDEVGGRA